jgi:hypothetical protein
MVVSDDGGVRAVSQREEKQSNPCSAPKICLFDENYSLLEFTGNLLVTLSNCAYLYSQLTR